MFCNTLQDRALLPALIIAYNSDVLQEVMLRLFKQFMPVSGAPDKIVATYVKSDI